jgi:S1-C subfamily serine protease
MHRRLVVLCILLAGCSFVSQSQAANLKEVFNKVKTSVVVVKTVQTKVLPEADQMLVSSGGLGSGVVISADGKVLTSAHVVQTADAVGVELSDGQMIPATVISSTMLADIALLQLEEVPEGVGVAVLGDSDKADVGDEVFIVGAPYGLSYSLTAGHISGRHRSGKVLWGLTELELFQTDAAINSGNSGGPVFNLKGEVVGIVSQILSVSGGFEGLGFAVTANVARTLIVEQPPYWAGLDGVILTDALARALNVPQPEALLLEQVAANSPAARLGLRGGTFNATIADQEICLGGDVLLDVGGVVANRANIINGSLRKVVAELQPGSSVPCRLLRAGTVQTLTYTRPVE